MEVEAHFCSHAVVLVIEIHAPIFLDWCFLVHANSVLFILTDRIWNLDIIQIQEVAMFNTYSVFVGLPCFAEYTRACDIVVLSTVGSIQFAVSSF